ncbi:MAG: tRNA threonylcarbamoyladenosine dehydratase [Alphaproteobacteria bacterium]|nr:tRNA threonylcarbamoyladenosine dehydratase [Alphaproteobacteria bacterium]
MISQFNRQEILLGSKALEALKKSRVAVFGIGGVGGYAAEALVRAGIGELDFIDSDVVSLTNLNRQIIALHSTLGKEKVDVMKARALDINPEVKINIHKCFYLPETAAKFDFKQYDYIIDAIDTVSGKIALVEEAYRCNTPIISAMGAGNKLNPALFEVADISKTKVCPLAKVMRKELKMRGILHLKVVYSQETPLKPANTEEQSGKRQTAGSISFVPPVVGLLMAAEVVKDLISKA